jgi:hypothetical protein
MEETQNLKPELHAYVVSDKDRESDIAVVAPTAKEAKRIVGGSVVMDAGCEWTDLRVRKTDAPVSDLQAGYTFDGKNAVQGLLRGIYEWVDQTPCPVCGALFARVYKSELGSAGYACEACIEKHEEIQENLKSANGCKNSNRAGLCNKDLRRQRELHPDLKGYLHRSCKDMCDKNECPGRE